MSGGEWQPPAKALLTHDRIAANRRRTVLLMVAFGLVIAPTVYWAFQYVNRWQHVNVSITAGLPQESSENQVLYRPLSTLALAIAIGAAVSIGQYLTATAQVLRALKARPLRSGEEPLLERVLENLCIGSGLPKPRLYVVESPDVNAFACGINRSSAVIGVTRGLLDLMDQRELEGVIAHELAHIANNDTNVNTLAAAMVQILLLPRRFTNSLWAIRWNRDKSGDSEPSAGAIFLALLMVFIAPSAYFMLTFNPKLAEQYGSSIGAAVISLLFLPLYVFQVAPSLGSLLKLAVSRQREYLADADAAHLTGNPAGIARALAKIDGASMAGSKLSAAAAHMYLADPRAHLRGLWQGLVSTHPAIDERLSVLAGLDTSITLSEIERARQAGRDYAERGGRASAYYAERGGVPAPEPVGRGVEFNANYAGGRVDVPDTEPARRGFGLNVGFSGGASHAPAPSYDDTTTDGDLAWLIRQRQLQDAALGGIASPSGAGGLPPLPPLRPSPPREPVKLVDAYVVGTAGAVLLEAPDTAAQVLARLQPGALLMLIGDADPFAQVITNDDRSGYVHRDSLTPAA